MSNSQQHPISIGRNIERLRKIKGMKQETLADALGITRQSVSKLEQSDNIDDEKLGQIAKALDVPISAIKNFNEAAAINNNIYDQNNTVINYNFNPIEKIVELYDALLKSEREKSALLQTLLDKEK